MIMILTINLNFISKKMIHQYKTLFLYNQNIINYLLFREHKIKSINYSLYVYLSLFKRKKYIELYNKKILITYLLKL